MHFGALAAEGEHRALQLSSSLISHHCCTLSVVISCLLHALVGCQLSQAKSLDLACDCDCDSDSRLPTANAVQVQALKLYNL
jgi:hypothetical protein